MTGPEHGTVGPRAAELLDVASWPAGAGPALRDLTVGQALREAAADAPETVALVEGAADPRGRRRWTYRQVLDESERAARALLARFSPGQRVALWADNLPEWVLLEHGAALAGLTVVTVNPALRAQELHHVLAHSGAAGVFLVPSYRGDDLLATLASVRDRLPALREVVRFDEWDRFLAEAEPGTGLPDVDPLSAAQLQYTSGTTGTPRGAVLQHRGVVNNAALYADRLGLRRGGVQVSPMPLFHTAGCGMSVLGALAVRGTLVLPRAFDPALVLRLLESEGAEALLGVPTMLLALLDAEQLGATDLSALRHVLSGGAVVPAALVRRVEQRTGATVSVVFAQTEASPVITQTAPGDSLADRCETVGRPLPHTEVRVVDPGTGRTLPVGQVGELVTRGYHVMTGYHADAGATAAAVDGEGWLRTGDLASMDERGCCRIAGRLKEMIIRGGENVYPREVEAVLIDHPDVADAAVVGLPDPVWGEQVAAVVRPAPGRTPDPAELFAHCRARLAPHKTPRRWAVVERLPLTGSGKVQKFRLREQLTAPTADVVTVGGTTGG